MSNQERLYQPLYGLMQPEIASSTTPISVEEITQFPTETTVVSKDQEEATYIPFELPSDVHTLFEWMNRTEITLPLLQTFQPYLREPYLSLAIQQSLYNHQTVGETTITLLQMLNECGGLMHVQKYFDGQKINFRRTFAQFTQSDAQEWGIQLGNNWKQLSLIQQDRLQELWVQHKAWQEITTAYEQANKQLKTTKPQSYLPISPVPQNEIQQERSYQIVRIIQELNDEMLLSDASGGFLYKADANLYITYFLDKKATLHTHLSSFVKMIGQLSTPVMASEFEKEKQHVLDAIQRFLFILYDPTDPTDRDNLTAHMAEVIEAFTKIPTDININQDDKQTSSTYKIIFSFPS